MKNIKKLATNMVSYLLVTAVVIVSLFTFPALAAEEAPAAWTRPADSAVAGIAYAGGTGVSEDPYIIETADQLYKAVYEDGKISGTSTGAYFSVTKDIDLSSAGWVPGSWDKLGNTSYGFTGVIEGNGHTISHLKVEDVTPAGLIWKAGNGATIKNLHIKDSSILAFHYAGAFIGYSEGTSTSFNTSITGCTVQNTDVKGNWAGGFIGVVSNSTVTISDCAFISGTISTMQSNNLYGGIIADGFCPVTIKDSYSVGYYAVPNTTNTAGFICENVYTDKADGLAGQTVLTIDQMKGDAAKNNMAFDWDSRWQTVTDGFPMPKVCEPPVEIIPWTVPSAAEVAEIAYAGGTGVSEDPYIIETGDQLYKAVYEDGKISGTSTGAYFSVTKDIDLSSAGWVPGSWDKLSNPAYGFTGVIEGNGHTISHLKVEDVTPAGLIWKAGDGATINNLHIKDSSILAYHYAGAFIGYSVGTSTSFKTSISGCTVQNTNVKGNWVGGFIGVVSNTTVTISDCAFISGTISTMQSNNLYGGIIADGFCPVTVKNSYSVGYYAVPDTTNTTPFVCENVYTDKADGLSGQTVLTIEQMKGDAAKNNMAFDWDSCWQTVADDFPMPRIIFKNGQKGAVWSGKTAEDYAGGEGTAADPYRIETAEQLRKMMVDACAVPEGSDPAYYILTADILINDTSDYIDWSTTAPKNNWYSSSLDRNFIGILNGNGYTVYGLYSAVSGTDKFTGLIQYAGRATELKNLHIRKSYLSGQYAGSLVGSVNGYVGYDAGILALKIEGCSADSTVTVNGKYAGGLIGVANAAVTVGDSYFTGNANNTNFQDGAQTIGGLCANYWGNNPTFTINNFYSEYFTLSVEASTAIKGTPVITATNVYYTGQEFANDKGIAHVDAYSGMTSLLNAEGWYSVPGKAPLLRNRGERLCDVSGNDALTFDATSLVVLRKFLLGVDGYQNIISDVNQDGKNDIRDLVSLKKK